MQSTSQDFKGQARGALTREAGRQSAGRDPAAPILERFGFSSKQDFFDRSIEYWNPTKTEYWREAGIDLVYGRAQGYEIWDVDGKRYIDAHLCGGVFNIGHLHPEVVAALDAASETMGIGNHHLPSVARTALARRLVETAPDSVSRAFFGSSGGEAIDIALKSARYATKRRVIAASSKAYHGTTGTALIATDPGYSEPFMSDHPDEVRFFDFNDPASLEAALRPGDVAAVIVETVPATNGFPMPSEDFYPQVRSLCDKYGTMLILDEVQTGLMRTGRMWAFQNYDVKPDMIVVGKGLSGGIQPISAVLMNEQAADWMHHEPFGHIGTFGGSELGAVAGLTVLDILQRPTVAPSVRYLSRRLREGFEAIQKANPDWVLNIRQNGLLMALEINHPQGVRRTQRACFQSGVLMISHSYNGSIVQFKPGALLSSELCDDLVDRVATGFAQAAADARAGR